MLKKHWNLLIVITITAFLIVVIPNTRESDFFGSTTDFSIASHSCTDGNVIITLKNTGTEYFKTDDLQVTRNGNLVNFVWETEYIAPDQIFAFYDRCSDAICEYSFDLMVGPASVASIHLIEACN